jgi:hypothetical protein
MPKLMPYLRLSPYLEIGLTFVVLAFLAYVVAGGFNRPVDDVADATVLRQQR